MNLEFNKLTVEHFRCFAAPQTFILSPGEFGTWFLRGVNEVEPRLQANGAGKSSLFMALCWCLYGATANGLKGPDIRPWSGVGTPRVDLELTIDGVGYLVRRVAKTNGTYIDGKEVGPDEIEKLIGLSYDVFTNTILLAQNQPLFFDRKPSEKMALFSDVLRLERWEVRSKAAAARVKELNLLLAELTGERTGFEASLEQSEELLKAAREASERWEKERRAKLKDAEARIGEYEKELKQASATLDNADLTYDGAMTEAKALRAEVLKLREVWYAAMALRNEASTALNLAETKLAKAREASKSNVCSECGQTIKGKHTHDLDGLRRDVSLSITAFEEAGERVDVLTARVETAQTNMLLFEEKANAANTTVHRLKPRVAELQTLLRLAKQSHEGDAEERNPHNEHIRSLTQKEKQLKLELKELQADITKTTQLIERNHFWVKGFKDVALYSVQEVLAELELVTPLMLSEFGLEGWEIHYAIEKEAKSGVVQRGINTTIVPPYDSKQKAPIKWESWSGGEGQRLRLVGALALSEVLLSHAGVNSNLEILDEPTRGLSPNGVMDLCTYLQDRAKRLKRNCWLVDHTARESSKFSGGAIVTKTPKGSVIKVY